MGRSVSEKENRRHRFHHGIYVSARCAVHLTIIAKSDRVTDVYLYKLGASFNVYPFHGGTNWGYTSGSQKVPGVDFVPVITSYDFNCPLTEAGRL